MASGSRAETPDEHGVAHMLEHMAFKGTQTRSARDIAEEIETAGGEINAATGVETTAYFARVLQDEVPRALDILADILRNPVYKDERDLAWSARSCFRRSPRRAIIRKTCCSTLAQDVAFPDQPLGRAVLGTAQSVRHFAATPDTRSATRITARSG